MLIGELMVLFHQIMDKSLVLKSQKGFCKPSKTESSTSE